MNEGTVAHISFVATDLNGVQKTYPSYEPAYRSGNTERLSVVYVPYKHRSEMPSNDNSLWYSSPLELYQAMQKRRTNNV